ncbi:MAG TPA: sulfate adenylyltransferase [Thermoplasmata archaeon]|nr:sulfate adenylyltransferase [Thermoplasmata archaeon]
MIPPPHGGRLVLSQAGVRAAERLRLETRDLPKLWPEVDHLYDAEKIGIGAYSPLEGFMNRETLDSVLRTSRLTNSLPWTIPILLSPPGGRNRRTIDLLRPGDDVALLDPRDRLVAVLHLREKFPIERARLAREIYQTMDTLHPNVADLQRTGDTALAGPIELVDRVETEVRQYEYTPTETRAMFARRHWATVAGYQTRNVPHRAHEHLQRLALEREEIDGLFIHPLVGRLKPGDYHGEVVLSAYETLIRNYFPADRVLLGSLSIAMRYAGPRAALFLAIIRKNYGCSHYIVGRDQAGVGDFYDPYDSHRIFDEFPVGVVPLRYYETFFCRRCDTMVSSKTCSHPDSFRVRTSQTQIRRSLVEGQPLPAEILRPEIASMLSRGVALFTAPSPETSYGWVGEDVAMAPGKPTTPGEHDPPSKKRRQDDLGRLEGLARSN